MTETTVISIIGLVMLTTNMSSTFFLFPRKRGLLSTIIIHVLSAIAYLAVLSLIGPLRPAYEFIRVVIGFGLIPLVIFLFKGELFQKVFAYFMNFLLTFLLLTFFREMPNIIPNSGTRRYNVMWLIFGLVLFASYIFIMFKFGCHFMKRLFAYGSWLEWLIYSFGVIFSFIIVNVFRAAPGGSWRFLLLLLFVIWSFGVLCYAIISTHEKTIKSHEANLARSIVASGRDHYQQMNEMYEKLRIMRHDYKYHLRAARGILNSGDTKGANEYLTSVENQLAKYELRCYCTNSVINALITSYAERCEKLGIRFIVDVSVIKTPAVPNYEICIIIGNLLENAVEACEKLKDNRVIELAAQNTSVQLLLMVKNSFDGKVTHDDSKLVSRKANGGFGLRSVREVITRHGGDLHMEWDNDTFTVYAAVRLEAEK